MVLKATQTQYNTLNGYTFNCSKLEFQKDFNNNWIVGIEVLNEIDFLEIRVKLNKLVKINFEPIIKDII